MERAIGVGTPTWFSWLEEATAFTFVSAHGTFTARRERASSGRGGWYWPAYQRRAGALRRTYLGKAEELTLERLQAVAATPASAAALRQAPDRAVASSSAPLGESIERRAHSTGTATFLFSDIAGSTQLWKQHPRNTSDFT